MKERLLRVARILAYPAFYLFCLFLFGYVAFPFSRLKDRIIGEFDRRAKAGQRLEIEKISSYWFTGIELTGVRMIFPKTDDTGSSAKMAAIGSSGEDSTPTKTKESVLSIEEAHLRLQFLPLLIGRTKLGFWISGMGGEMKGVMPVGGSKGDIDITLDKIDIAKITPLQQAVGGVPIRGEVSGNIAFTPEEGRLSKANGRLDLTVANVVVSDGKTKIQGLIELPAAQLGDLTLSAEAKEGVLKIEKLAATGKDLELAGDGRIGLHDNWQNSVADFFIRFKFTDAYRGKNDLTKTLLGTPGSTAPALIDTQVAKMKKAKRADGFYGFHAHGALKRIQFDASAEGGASAKPSAAGAGAAGIRGASPFGGGAKRGVGMNPTPDASGLPQIPPADAPTRAPAADGAREVASPKPGDDPNPMPEPAQPPTPAAPPEHDAPAPAPAPEPPPAAEAPAE